MVIVILNYLYCKNNDDFFTEGITIIECFMYEKYGGI